MLGSSSPKEKSDWTTCHLQPLYSLPLSSQEKKNRSESVEVAVQGESSEEPSVRLRDRPGHCAKITLESVREMPVLLAEW